MKSPKFLQGILNMNSPQKVRDLIQGLEIAITTANDPIQRDLTQEMKKTAITRLDQLTLNVIVNGHGGNEEF